MKHTLDCSAIELRLVQTCVKRMRLRSKIENFLTEHDLRVRKNWPMLLRFTRSVWMSLYPEAVFTVKAAVLQRQVGMLKGVTHFT